MVAKHTIFADAASRPTFDYVNGRGRALLYGQNFLGLSKVSRRSLATNVGIKRV